MSAGRLRYAKAKGREGEQAVEALLKARGIPAERRRLAGVLDCGDISGWKSVMVECKDRKRIDLAGLMDEVASQTRNCNARFPEAAPHFGFGVVKRKGHPKNPEDWYAVLSLGAMVELMQRAGFK